MGLPRRHDPARTCQLAHARIGAGQLVERHVRLRREGARATARVLREVADADMLGLVEAVVEHGPRVGVDLVRQSGLAADAIGCESPCCT